MYLDREFIIFPTSELNKINFNEVLENSSETVRKSVNGTKTLVKWDGPNPPACISTLTGTEGPYTYVEILDIMATPEWTDPPNP